MGLPKPPVFNPPKPPAFKPPVFNPPKPPVINPGSGLPMQGGNIGGYDLRGNLYGRNKGYK